MPLGCIVSLITMKIGRRVAVATAGIVCSAGWVIIASSYSIPQLLVGRFVTGFATGLASTPGSVYLAEISTPRFTAALTSCTSLFASLGIMLIYLLAFATSEDWRLEAALSTLIPLLSGISAAYFLPESPRWLLDKSRKDEAKRSLLRLRGLKEETEGFKEEFTTMVGYSESRNEIELTSGDEETLRPGPTVLENLWKNLNLMAKTLKITEVWKPLIILNVFFLFQQFCGIYVLFAYSVKVMEMAGVTQDPYIITIVIGLLQLIGCATLVCCSTRIGRRPAAVISGVGMSISLAVLGVYNQFFKSSCFSSVPLACVLFFACTGSFGFFSLPWAMIGELYPTKFVNILGPLTTCMASFYNFASVQLFPTLVQFDAIATIYLYCAVSVAATIFVVLALPETLGKSKSEIEAQFKEINRL